MKKVNGFPVFPDPADEGNGKPEPDPGDDKDNMVDEGNGKPEPEINSFPGDDKDNMKDKMMVKIDQILEELSEIKKLIAYSEYQLKLTKDEALKALQEEEGKMLKRKRDILGDELTKVVILRELQDIIKTLDYCENQVTIGENEVLKELKEKAVANLKRALKRLLEELRNINRKRIDE